MSLATVSLVFVGALQGTPTSAAAQEIDIGSADVDASGKATVTVSLASGARVGGTINSIVFHNTILTLAPGDCDINPTIGLNPGGADCTSDTSVGPCKNLVTYLNQCGGSPEPQGCPAGTNANVSALTAIIAATEAPNTNAIPDGALYVCTFTVANRAGLPTTLTNGLIAISDPTGHLICSSSGAQTCGGSNGVVAQVSASDCCQCPTSCAAPINGSCGAGCTPVIGATCESGELCVLHSPTPSPTPTATKPSPTPSQTATKTPGASDCCQCTEFCAAPIAGTCGGCSVVYGASCAGGVQCVSRTPTTTRCVGDCNGDGHVTVDEIVTMVNLALNGGISGCPAGDANGDGQITVDEIVRAVSNALNGCPLTLVQRVVG